MSFSNISAALLACCALALAMGCGDDSTGNNNNNVNDNDNDNVNDNNDNNNNVNIDPFTGTLDELDGYYEITGATLRPSAVEIPLTTENTSVSLPEFGGTTARVMGYADLAASGATDGQVELRWGVVADANSYGDVGYYVEAFDFTATWEQADGKLVLTDGGDIGVYLVEFAAEVLTLHYDDSDWRSNLDAIRMAKRWEFTRTTPTAGALDGVWNPHSATYNAGELNEYSEYSVCTLLDPDDPKDGLSGQLTGFITLGPAGWIRYDELTETFDSTDCSGMYEEHFATQFYGFFELDPGAGTFDMYMYSPEFGLNEFGYTYGYTLDATELTLTFMDYRDMVPNPYSGPDNTVYTSAP